MINALRVVCRKVQFSFFTCLSVMPLTACEPGYFVDSSTRYAQNLNIIDSYEIKRQSRMSFPRSANFYVAKNQTEKSDYVEEVISDALVRSFDHFFDTVALGSGKQGVDGALKEANVLRMNYMVYPRLEVWNDALSRWDPYSHALIPQKTRVKQENLLGARSWKSSRVYAVEDSQENDQLRLELVVYDVVSGKQLDSIRLNTKTGFLSHSSNRPLLALQEPLTYLVEQLSGSRGQY